MVIWRNSEILLSVFRCDSENFLSSFLAGIFLSVLIFRDFNSAILDPWWSGAI